MGLCERALSGFLEEISERGKFKNSFLEVRFDFCVLFFKFEGGRFWENKKAVGEVMLDGSAPYVGNRDC